MSSVVSVIIPVYNVERFVGKCLASIVSQSYEDFEIVVVDDGSTDKSGEICDEYAQKDKRIKVIHTENGGVSSARNIGLKNSTGKYVTFADPDDFLDVRCFEKVLGLIEKNDADAVFWGYEYCSEDETAYFPMAFLKEGHVDKYEALYQCFVSKGYFTSIWNKLFLKTAIQTKNGENIYFDKDYVVGEDQIWLTAALTNSRVEKVILTKEVFYKVRQREGSASRSSKKAKNRQDMVDSLLKVFEMVKATTNYNNLYGILKYRLWRLLIVCYIEGYEEEYRRIKKLIKKMKFKELDLYSFSFKGKVKVFTIFLSEKIGLPRKFVALIDSVH